MSSKEAKLISQLRAGMVELDVDAIEPALHPDVIWGDCASRSNVIGMLAMFKKQGATVTSSSFEQLDDRIVVTIEAAIGEHTNTSHNAVFADHDGLIIEIRDAPDAATARTITRKGPFPNVATSTGFNSVAPVLAVGDMAAAIEHYERLGFDVESYDGGNFYAFASRGEITLHLAHVASIDPLTSNVAAYLHVDDAKALFAEWRAAGVAEAQGRLHAPSDTDYGLCEGAHIDPWGNLLRFGSPTS